MDSAIPDWVPRRVADEAEIQFELFWHSPELQARIVALTCDPRMRVVWNEFNKKTNPKDASEITYRYPITIGIEELWRHNCVSFTGLADVFEQSGETAKAARIESLMPQRPAESDAHALRDLVAGYFFIELINNIVSPKTVVTIAGKSERRRQAMVVVRQFESTAQLLLQHGYRRQASALMKIADDFLTDSDPFGEEPLILRRAKGDTRLRGFVLIMAKVTRDLFGIHMPGILAVVAKVALGKAVTTDRVKSILKSRKPKKNPQSDS